jgi:hypothetical protein
MRRRAQRGNNIAEFVIGQGQVRHECLFNTRFELGSKKRASIGQCIV